MNKEELQAFDDAIIALRLDDMNHSAYVMQSLKFKLTTKQESVTDEEIEEYINTIGHHLVGEPLEAMAYYTIEDLQRVAKWMRDKLQAQPQQTVSDEDIENLAIDSLKDKWSHCFIDGKLIQKPKDFWKQLSDRVFGMKLMRDKLQAQPQQTVSDDAKKIHLCINLLSSMVYGGEEHSETSKQAISQAKMALDKLQAQTNEGELRGALELASKMINHVGCINSGCDGNGAIQVAEDEWEQCQWCDERQKINEALQNTNKDE